MKSKWESSYVNVLNSKAEDILNKYQRQIRKLRQIMALLTELNIDYLQYDFYSDNTLMI